MKRLGPEQHKIERNQMKKTLLKEHDMSFDFFTNRKPLASNSTINCHMIIMPVKKNFKYT
jgi:hypothetical protein